MSNEVKTFIVHDETDTDMFHVYVNKQIGTQRRPWLLCSLHIDLLGEILDQETLEVITGLAQGDWEWITLDIGLVEDD